MKRVTFVFAWFALSMGCVSAAEAADFYVATNGSDDVAGTSADGPFATLERARDAVRDLKKTKSPNIVVLVRGGTYRLDETVVFGLEDSGAGDSTITYAAYPDETPVFSSGREVTGFKKVTGELLGLPAAAQGHVFVAENLIYKCVSQGIMLKLNIRCENNIVAGIIAPPRGNYLAMREGPMKGGTVLRNILYSSTENCIFVDEPQLGKSAKTEDHRGREFAQVKDTHCDHNIYFCKADPDKGATLIETHRRAGIDKNSQSIDPRFVDPENGDFRFKPDSPALKMGIVPINMSKIGLR